MSIGDLTQQQYRSKRLTWTLEEVYRPTSPEEACPRCGRVVIPDAAGRCPVCRSCLRCEA